MEAYRTAFLIALEWGDDREKGGSLWTKVKGTWRRLGASPDLD